MFCNNVVSDHRKKIQRFLKIALILACSTHISLEAFPEQAYGNTRRSKDTSASVLQADALAKATGLESYTLFPQDKNILKEGVIIYEDTKKGFAKVALSYRKKEGAKSADIIEFCVPFKKKKISETQKFELNKPAYQGTKSDIEKSIKYKALSLLGFKDDQRKFLESSSKEELIQKVNVFLKKKGMKPLDTPSLLSTPDHMEYALCDIDTGTGSIRSKDAASKALVTYGKDGKNHKAVVSLYKKEGIFDALKPEVLGDVAKNVFQRKRWGNNDHPKGFAQIFKNNFFKNFGFSHFDPGGFFSKVFGNKNLKGDFISKIRKKFPEEIPEGATITAFNHVRDHHQSLGYGKNKKNTSKNHLKVVFQHKGKTETKYFIKNAEGWKVCKDPIAELEKKFSVIW